MRRKAKQSKSNRPTKLGLPDLEHPKSAVLASPRFPESQREWMSAFSIVDSPRLRDNRRRLEFVRSTHVFEAHNETTT